MIIYGLFGYYHHGWVRVLTVMSPEGATAALVHVEPGDGVGTNAGEGLLTRYVGERAGALDRLIEKHDILVLSKAEWDAKKAELGDAIWR